MSEFEFWEELRTRGQISNIWWYDAAVIPATIVALMIFFLMWFALRREQSMLTIYGWLVFAGLPLLLIVPSFIVSQWLFVGLDQIGFVPPPTVQGLSSATLQRIGSYLSQLAVMGMAGTSVAFVLFFASTLVGGFAPAPLKVLSQNITSAVTRVFGTRRRVGGQLTSPHGVLKVTRGNHQGYQFGITDGAMLGKSDVQMILTDPIVSRRHARINVQQDQVSITDENSLNGTYLQRNGQNQDVAGQAVMLQPGDKIYLGAPDLDESVELVYERPQPGSADQSSPTARLGGGN